MPYFWWIGKEPGFKFVQVVVTAEGDGSFAAGPDCAAASGDESINQRSVQA